MSLQIRVHLGNFKTATRTFDETLDFIKQSVVQQVEDRLLADTGSDLPYLVVHLSNTFWSFHSFGYARKVHSIDAILRAWHLRTSSVCCVKALATFTT